jgi:hypothetical protein
MALRGTLRDFGLADIFQLIGIQRKTGVLQLSNGERKVIVSFLSGSVVSADATRPALEDRLGSVLVNSGKITEKQLADALKVQKGNLKRLGRILVEQKTITAEDLREALRLQVTQIVYNLFRWRDGEYDFSQEETIDYEREFFQPIPAENILMEGARMVDEWPIIERRIPDFGIVLQPAAAAAEGPAAPASIYETDIGFRPDVPTEGGEKPGDAGEELSEEERTVLRLVDGRATVQEIIDRAQIGEFETCRILYELLNRGAIRAGESEIARTEAPPAPARQSMILRACLFLLPVLAVLSLATSARSPISPIAGGRARDPFGVERIRSHLSQARVGRIDRALRLFYLDKQTLPVTLETLVSEGFLGPRDLVDPWGRKYDFLLQPSGYTIQGFGPDGAPDESVSAESRFLGPERLTMEGAAGRGEHDTGRPDLPPSRPGVAGGLDSAPSGS